MPGSKVELVVGKPGQFDVLAEGGALVFSKHAVGRFPDPGEVVGKLLPPSAPR